MSDGPHGGLNATAMGEGAGLPPARSLTNCGPCCSRHGGLGRYNSGMSTVPYKPQRRLDLGLVGQLPEARAGGETRDCTREDVARFERHGRYVLWTIVGMPVFLLALFCFVRVFGVRSPAVALLVVPVMLGGLAWFACNVFRSARCIWCDDKLNDQPRIPRPQCCARCKQPLTLKAWDARVPRDSGGGVVPRLTWCVSARM